MTMSQVVAAVRDEEGVMRRDIFGTKRYSISLLATSRK
jgi:predicted RNA-binding protein